MTRNTNNKLTRSQTIPARKVAIDHPDVPTDVTAQNWGRTRPQNWGKAPLQHGGNNDQSDGSAYDRNGAKR